MLAIMHFQGLPTIKIEASLAFKNGYSFLFASKSFQIFVYWKLVEYERQHVMLCDTSNLLCDTSNLQSYLNYLSYLKLLKLPSLNRRIVTSHQTGPSYFQSP